MARGVGAVTQFAEIRHDRRRLHEPALGARCSRFLKTRPELETPDVQMHIVPYSIKDPKTRKLQDFPSMTIACYQLRPESLGSIHIRSARSAGAARDPLQLPRRPDRPGGDGRGLPHDAAPDRRSRADGPSTAARSSRPASMSRRDEQILDWIRNNSQTAYHPIGTCRMGPAGPYAVVDDKLRVHGLEGLRVADASIFPTMPSGNTNAPSIMVGEKCADLIKAERRMRVAA